VKSAWAAAALLGLCAFPCIGQTPQAPPASSIVTNAQEVLVDLVARDKKGNLVLNLTPADLQITDNGSPVKVKDLRFITGGGPAAGKDGEPHLVRVVSLVFENVGNESSRLAREAADEMLRTDPAAEIYFAVLQISGRLRLLQPWTTDRALVHRAVDAATAGARTHSDFDADTAERTLLSSYGSSGNAKEQLLQGNASGLSSPLTGPSFAPMMIETLQESQQIARDQQSRPSLAALLALAQQQGNVPGRKAIVYFCEGMPLTAGTKEALDKVMTAANRSNVNVYAVDVSGLSMENQTEAGRQMLATAAQASRYSLAAPSGPTVFNGSPEAGATGTNSGGSAPPGSQGLLHLTDRAQDAVVSSSQASLIDLARNTGGFYIGNSNDLRKPARRLMEEVASYYEASYVPLNPKYDGSFHPLVVKVLRKNVTVQARNGYVALPPGTPANVQPWEAGMLKYLAATELPAQLDFRSQVVPFGRDGDETTASLVIELPLRQLEYREDGNTKSFQLHPMVLALLKDGSGKVVHKFSQDLPLRGAVEAMERTRDGAYTMERSFTAKPGEYTLEVAVSDALGGRAVARRGPIVVPAVASGLGLSGVALVRRCDAFPQTAGADKAAAAEPFRYRNVRVVPSLEPAIDKTRVEAIPAFFVIYPDAASKEKPKLELALSWRGQALGRFPMDLPAVSGPVLPFMASIPSEPLRPGAYELTAIVTQGSEVVRQKMSFNLEGPEPPAAVASAPAIGVATAGADRGDEETTAEKAMPEAKLRAAISISRIENAERPAADEQKRIIAIARQRALEYESTLPNFTCIQKTRRLIDPTGKNKWRASDNITELLRYVDHEEVRQTMEVDGRRVTTARTSFLGVRSSGEFGVLLQAVFDPEVKAEFAWKELASIGDHTCQVFSFHVEAKKSKYALRAGSNGALRRNVGFHGVVYIDSNSYSVRRVSIEAENVPVSFPVTASSLWVDYDLMQVGDHDYMLPVSAEVLARTGKHRMTRNEITFRDYRRFGAESSIEFGDNR